MKEDQPETLDARVLQEVMALEQGLAAADLLPLVYKQLRSLAAAQLSREKAGQTLQATALVHEAWVRVVGNEDPGWECRAHFFGAAAQAMRQILIQQARHKSRLKTGGAWGRTDLSDQFPALESQYSHEDLISIDDALEDLERQDPLQAQVVMLRFFTGLTMDSIASMLGLPLKRIEREWRFARSWLQRRVSGSSTEVEE